MLKRILAAVSAILCAGAIAFAANIPLLTGPQPAGDLVSIVNTLIRSINSGVSGILSTSLTAVGTGADVTEDTLHTYSMPAGTLGTNGNGVRVTCWGSTGANGNNKTMKLYFGASSISTGAIAANAQTWFLKLLVLRTGAATQIVQGEGVSGTASVTPVAVYNNSAGTDNLAAAVTIKCTGQNGTASANDIIATGMLVESIR